MPSIVRPARAFSACEMNDARQQQVLARVMQQGGEAGRPARDQSFLTTMFGNLLLMSFAFSAILIATLRAICL